MRSAPASSKPANHGGAAGDKAPNILGGASQQQPPSQVADDRPFRYTHEAMLKLFKAQPAAEDFVVDERVFSSEALAPVSMTEMTAEEQGIFAGPINSNMPKRYGQGQQGQQQGQQQQGGRQMSPSNYGSRSSGYHRQGNGNSGTAGGIRGRARGYGKSDDGIENGNAGGLGDDLDGGDDDGSLWAAQSINRENVGMFGADGVFRMGGGDEDESLEGPSRRESMWSSSRRNTSAYSSRAASPNPALLRSGSGAAGGGSGSLRSSADDGGMWRDPAIKSASTTPMSLQQRRLLERAEASQWWYRDPQGSVQGPFTAAQMQDWHSGGYFPANLQVCLEGGTGFEALGSLVARVGGNPKVFLYAALAAETQRHQASASNISSPATPSAVSRTGSAARLYSSATDEPPMTISNALSGVGQSDVKQPLAAHQAYSGNPGFAAPVPISAPAAASAVAPAPVGSPAADPRQAGGSSALASPQTNVAPVNGAASQSVQLAMLLKEQQALVSGIAECQQVALNLQEEMQRGINHLMQTLAQQSSQLHMNAQATNVPVQTDVLIDLQREAMATEGRIRSEYTHYIQAKATQIMHFEAKLDPVIRDMVLREGAALALSFIKQQLEQLNTQIASEGEQQQLQQQQTAPGSESEAPIPTAPATAPATAPEPVEKTPTAQPASRPETKEKEAEVLATADEAAANVEAIGEELKKASIEEKPKEPEKPKEKASTKSDKEVAEPESAADSTKASKKASKQAAAKAKKAAAVPSAIQTDSSAEVKSPTVSVPATPATPVSPAPWSKTTQAKKQPKKSLLQIQQEEEEAMKKRQLAETQQRAKQVSTRSFGASYADRLNSNAGSTANARSLAEIMAEQSKESAAVAAVNAANAAAATVAAVASARASAAAAEARSAPIVTSTGGPAWGNAAASPTTSVHSLSATPTSAAAKSPIATKSATAAKA
ncbi:kinesin-like protein, partial [Linderina macrospora]